MQSTKENRGLPGKETAPLHINLPEKRNLAIDSDSLNQAQKATSSNLYIPKIGGRWPIVRADKLTSKKCDLEFLPFLDRNDIIPKGYSILIAGKPKAGKTELTIRTALSWANINKNVLYISEESEIIWIKRLQNLAGQLDHIFICCALGAPEYEIRKTISSFQAEIIIIDTVRNIVGLKDEKDNSEIARVLNPIIAAARRKGKTIIFLHHQRKGMGEYGDSVSGGHAFLGSVDLYLELSHDSKNKNRRVVKGSGRIVQIPDLFYEWDEKKRDICISGTLLDTSANSVQEKLLKGPVSETWKKQRDIEADIEPPTPSSEQVRQTLISLAQEGKIERQPSIEEENKPGTTYYWRIKPLEKGGDQQNS